MRAVTTKVFDESRTELAEFYPFTIIIQTVKEKFILLCENLKVAAQYCIEFIRLAPKDFLKRSPGTINLTVLRTDGNVALIKDFIPINLDWTFDKSKIFLTFSSLRISDGIRLKPYLTKLEKIK